MKIISAALLLALSASPVVGETECKPLRNPDPQPGGQFGCSVAVRGGTTAVGANLDGAGSVTVFQESTRIRITPSDGRKGDEFGRAVAAADGWLAVGAPFADSRGASGSGVVYLFQNQDGRWIERQKLFAGDAARGDQFGFSIALSDGVLLIGAPFDGDAGSLSGSAYIFRLEGSAWVQRQKLTAGDAAPFDNFGFYVALDRGIAVVGAPFHDGPGGGNSGAAYVFERNGEVWSQRARLTAGGGAADDEFGSAVAVSGGFLAVGARGDDVDRLQDAGSAYVYERRGTDWSEAARFFGEAAGDLFGVSAAMSGNRLLIGALLHDANGADSGAAYLYERRRQPNGTFQWEPEGRPFPGGAAGDRFGQAVSIDGADFVVGAYLADVGSMRDAGSACARSPEIPIAITKTDGPNVNQVSPGQTITYTITVINTSDQALPQVRVTDTFPPELLRVTWCPPEAQPTCTDRISGNIDRTFSLPPLGQAVFTATAVVDPNASGSLINTAHAFLGEDSVSAQDIDRIVRVNGKADLDLVKTAPASVQVGGRLTYKLTVRNQGPDLATGVVLDDRIPQGLQPVSPLPSNCQIARGVISCSLGSLLPGRAANVQLAFKVLDVCATPVVNSASVRANEADLHPEDNEDQIPTSVARTANLALQKTGPSSVKPGDQVSHALKVTNLGPDRACGVVLTDPVPAGLVSPAAPDCAVTANEVRCSIGELPAGDSRTFPLSFTVSQAAACGGKIINTAIATAVGSTTASSELVTTTVAASDLSISNTDGLATAAPGQILLYEITVRNLGNGGVAAATVTDMFPPGLTQVRWCRDPDAGGPCTPNLTGDLQDTISLPAGGSATYRVRGIVSVSLGVLRNIASVTGPPGCADVNLNNNTASDGTVICDTGVTALCKSINGLFLEGETISYTFVLRNSGPAAQADNPGDEFKDTLPAGLTLTGASADSGTAAIAGNMATWNGSIPAGGMVTVTITAKINPGTVGTTVCNQAMIAFDANGNGTNESNGLSDDPDQPGPADPCCFQVLTAAQIPTLSEVGLAALALLLAALALARLRIL